ncbi:MAG: DUF4964 domain-containing protein, partial [Ignavibacteriaceae bacterium]
MKIIFIHFIIFLLCIIPGLSIAQSSVTRPPAVPLITSNPYFSIWSFANNPTEDYTRHWTGSTMSIYSMVKIDNKAYRLLGSNVGSIPALKLKQKIINPTQTIFIYNDDGIELKLLFTIPLLP